MSEPAITLEGFLEGIRKLKQPPSERVYVGVWNPDNYRAILEIDAKWRKIYRAAKTIKRNRAKRRRRD